MYVWLDGVYFGILGHQDTSFGIFQLFIILWLTVIYFFGESEPWPLGPLRTSSSTLLMYMRYGRTSLRHWKPVVRCEFWMSSCDLLLYYKTYKLPGFQVNFSYVRWPKLCRDNGHGLSVKRETLCYIGRTPALSRDPRDGVRETINCASVASYHLGPGKQLQIGVTQMLTYQWKI